MGRHTIHISTGKRDLNGANEYVRDVFLKHKFCHGKDLFLVTKKFSDAAKLAIVDICNLLEAGLGCKIFVDGLAFLAACFESVIACLITGI